MTAIAEVESWLIYQYVTIECSNCLWWALEYILHLEVNINKYTPLHGSSFIPLPKFIQYKKAVVNVQNNDQQCFLWAVVSALFPKLDLSTETSSYPQPSTVLNTTVMTESAFKARDIGLRAQKKILSRMAGKNVARVFIDDTTASLLDNLYRLAKQYSNNKKEAEKLVKNIIKIVIKLGVLHRNNLFSEEELKQAEKFKSKFRMISMAIISFYEVDFSYDRNYISQAFSECRKCLEFIVSKHLTDKSLLRIESVFCFFTNDQFLDSIFKRDSEYRDALGRVVNDLNQAIENGDL